MALALQAPTARPPLPRKAMVRRPRLVRALRMAREVPLAVVVAPAGYGKTTLLAEWARGGRWRQRRTARRGRDGAGRARAGRRGDAGRALPARDVRPRGRRRAPPAP